nr:MAG TPA: hypothetical protein [Caudoviricetes sp.]DAS49075.1 MAG TPA: hypothetical protein [Caudoviricetes sp.]
MVKTTVNFCLLLFKGNEMSLRSKRTLERVEGAKE